MARPKMFIELNNTTFTNARFIPTNFSGDPNRSNFKSSSREGFIYIQDRELAQHLAADGFNIKETRPAPDFVGEFVPEYFVSVKLNFTPVGTNPPPTVTLITPLGDAIELDENTVCQIDDANDRGNIASVDCVCNLYFGPRGNTLYIQHLTVRLTDENDPYKGYVRYV